MRVEGSRLVVPKKKEKNTPGSLGKKMQWSRDWKRSDERRGGREKKREKNARKEKPYYCHSK